jgi:hypothetical protein
MLSFAGRLLRWPALSAAPLLLCLAAPVPAAESSRAAVGEYQVKAAFLYHFAKFVEWPHSSTSGDSIAVCVIGEDPFGPVLDFTFEDKSLNGRRFEVRRLAGSPELQACPILFVSRSENNKTGQILQALRQAPVLTVGESQQFQEAGGMIHLVLDESKVRFDINLAAAKDAGLRISAQLLRLARRVQGK